MRNEMPKSTIAAVLVGFPLVSTALSLLLLERGSLAWTGLEFFTAFWSLVTGWYLLQLLLLARALRSAGWGWADVGLDQGRRRLGWMIGGYLLFAFALVALIEYLLGSATLDARQLQALSDLSNLTPKTLPQRIVFVFMGLAAGLAEELVYRGFAINALRSQGLNRWLACGLAAIPFVFQHGLKSIDQFGWFLAWGLLLGALFVWRKRLYVPLLVHWLVILSALPAILQVLRPG